MALRNRVPYRMQTRDEAVPIWPGAAPGSERWTQTEVVYQDGGGKTMVRNVVTPTLTPLLPERDKATGTGIVICPGGGFRFHSWDSEGMEVGRWLQARGVAAFVLKYRVLDTGATPEAFQKNLADFFALLSKPGPNGALPADPQRERILPLAVADGRQSLVVVRRRSAEWGVDLTRIGMMGFSAGAMVTMGVVMDRDPFRRPAFAAPIYGGGTGGAAVPVDAPPLFVLVAGDDALTATGCVKLAGEWQAAKRPVEMHLYAKGGHGFGMRQQGLPVDSWIDRLGDWLGAQGLLKR